MLDQDVQSRVDAYRGNPQALQQKYSVSKDLLDLMALQKLTKEKEAAARELQMAMAAQQGQGPGTIRDQLQQKAIGITTQELAQQQAKMLQQKQQQQQQQQPPPQPPQQPQPEDPQQLAQSGIAQNPTPNMAGPGFAGGGIIAFAGPTGSQVPRPFEDPYSDVNVARDKIRRGEPLTEREENLLLGKERLLMAPMEPLTPPAPELRRRVTGRGFEMVENEPSAPSVPTPPQYGARRRVMGRGTEMAEPSAREQLDQLANELSAPRSYANPNYGNEGRPATAPSPGIPSVLPQRPDAPSQAAQAAQAAQAQPQPQPRPRPAARPPEAAINITTGAAGFPMTAAPGIPAERPAEAAPAQAASPPETAGGIAGLPAAQGAQSAPTGFTGIQAASPQDEGGNLRPEESTIAAKAARKIMSMLDGTENPKTAAQEIREGFKSEYALTEEEKRDRKQYQDMLRARHATLSDPEDIRREKLKQTLLGMAGASNAGIALARGAATGQNYEAGRNAEALKTLSDLNDIGEKEISARRAGALKGFELAGQEGQNVRTSSTAARTAATNALVNLMGFDARSADAKRELESREKVANAEIMARKDIAGWDNKTKIDVVNATNEMHRQVQQMVGQVQRDVAGMQTASHEKVAAGQNASRERTSAGDNAATRYSADIQRTARLEEAVMNNRARLVTIAENAEKAIDAAAAKERAALMALVPSTGPNAAQKKQLEAIDSGANALKADVRARMNQQISDVGLENVLGPNPLAAGQKKGQGGYTVTRE